MAILRAVEVFAADILPQCMGTAEVGRERWSIWGQQGHRWGQEEESCQSLEVRERWDRK